LLTGAICARILLVRQYAPASALADGLAGLGLGLILAAVFAFDARTPFPSVYALAPVLGTALIILFAEQGRLVKGFLSVRVLVWIGLISYSAYLWHQPLFAFARLASQEPPTAVTYLVLAVLSIALAHLTWRCVERPFRRLPSAGTRPSPRLWTGYVMLSATLICLGLAGNFTAGFPGRMSPEQLQILTWLNYGDRNRDQDPCLINSTTARGKPPAACVPDGSDVLLIGDSHAHALAAGWPSGSDLASVTASACPPIPGFRDESRPGCEATIRFTYEAIARVKPRMIILHAHWSHYMTPQLLEAFGAALTRIGAESPGSRIVVLGSIPKWYPSLPESLVQSGNSLKADLFLPLNFTNLVRLDNDLARIASRHDNTVFISLIDGLCSAGRCRATLPNRAIPLIWDDAHLTVEGAEFVHDNILLPALSLPMAIAD
jgi:hypothetical protein